MFKDDVEKLIAAFNEKERELNQVKENVLPDGKVCFYDENLI